ncbi:hypothetical protein [Tenacibaculum jejuense]|uniref:Uncharacterized protein n=1 Tax=Tenacibaculum jejuense TaxID=584609 RepID=A0A238U9Y0_9FLAO|nr:hypothetical protein [Tenacibaculum jejuense]SNR16007.1 protein of unknown function [Tenacibaculum jejuense]
MSTKITINDGYSLTKLNSQVNYNPQQNYPAVTIFPNGNNNYTVFAICYVPTGGLITKTVEEFNKGQYEYSKVKYSPSDNGITVPLVGDDSAATVVLSYFADIEHADLDQGSGTEFTARSFAVCYDFDPCGAPYECDVYTLEFNYTVIDGSSYEVLFLTQGDLDPRLSRGTISAPATPPPPTLK